MQLARRITDRSIPPGLLLIYPLLHKFVRTCKGSNMCATIVDVRRGRPVTIAVRSNILSGAPPYRYTLRMYTADWWKYKQRVITSERALRLLDISDRRYGNA